jgi:exosortase
LLSILISMSSTVTEPAPTLLEERPTSSSRWKTWVPILLFAVLWADLCRQLSYMWSTNEQYAFGWFVPLLALGLFIKKWPSRPVPSSVVSGQWSVVSSPVVSSLVVLLSLLLLPLRVIHEINQDWSFCGYLLTLAVVALSLYAIFLMGGWPWVRHFAFPICFILVAVNWPYRIENSLKYRLMNAVSGLTVEIIGWLGVPTVQHGNVIELATGSVGVEDACSGIRSLQSTIMAALVLGELYLLKLPRRFLLLALGAPLAFSFNIVRTLFLTWQASSAGNAAIAKWHDSAGMTISIACFGCLWAIALLLKKQDHKTTDLRALTSAGSLSAGGPRSAVRSEDLGHPSGGGVGNSLGRGEVASAVSSPVVSSQWSVVSKYLVALGLWSLCIIALTEAWYRSHETDPAQTVRWSAQFPTNSPSALKRPVSKEIRQILKCDQGDGFSWEEQDGSKWSAFFFRWRSGEATSRMAARDHCPEICLPSRGYNVKADLGILLLPAHGLQLPFRAYIFKDEERPLYVFFCLWEDGADKQTGLGRSKYLDRLNSVLAGKRRLGQQTLEIIVNGYASEQEAVQAMRQRLPSLIQLEAPPGSHASLDQPSRR